MLKEDNSQSRKLSKEEIIRVQEILINRLKAELYE